MIFTLNTVLCRIIRIHLLGIILGFRIKLSISPQNMFKAMVKNLFKVIQKNIYKYHIVWVITLEISFNMLYFFMINIIVKNLWNAHRINKLNTGRYKLIRMHFPLNYAFLSDLNFSIFTDFYVPYIA